MGFIDANNVQEKEILPGIFQKVLAGHDGGVMLVWYRLVKGADMPVHTHENSQSGIMIEGAAEFTLGDDVKQIGPGDAYSIPPGIPHGAKFTENSIVVDAFYPPRQDFLE